MFPNKFGYLAPRSVDEAIQLLVNHGEDAKLLAGGHSLIPAMKLRLASPRYLIDLGQVPGLSGIRIEGNEMVIGALTVHADILTSEIIHQRVPGLSDAARVRGDFQVRNRGTVGGSLAHADPGADFPVMLTALNASAIARSPSGERSISLNDFFVDFYTTVLEQNEILTAIRVPLPGAKSGTAYKKSANPASGYVVVSAGVVLTRDSAGNCASARIVMGGLGSGPFRATATEQALAGRALTAENIAAAAQKAADGSDPQDDLYASVDYKRQLAMVMAERAIELAVERTNT